MRGYGCVYQNREQFVFEERGVSYRAGLWATVGGVTVGVVLSIALILMNKVASIMLFLSVVGYLVFRILSIALKSDPVGTSIFVSAMGGSLVILYYLQETVFNMWGENSWHLMLFYTTVFGVLAPLAYLYAQVAFIEDKRKHQLLLVADSRVASPVGTAEEGESRFGDFASWCRIIVLDFFRVLPVSGFRVFPPLYDAKLSEVDGIEVRNETLKRIKICLYHPSDYCCWIPLGGIGGPSVAFIGAGETQIIHAPFPEITSFKLKVFSPSLIDRELCFEPRCHRGETFLVKDVQQRIVERVRDDQVAQTHTPPPSRESSSTSLRKNVSFSSSHELSFLADFCGSHKAAEDAKIFEDEIFVFNASSAEVTLTFYLEDAVSFLFPLTRDVQGQRTIPKQQGRKFRCLVESKLLCLRANHGTHELDFCTVQRGHSYTVTDGLID